MAPLSNAERQARWRAKRDALARKALDIDKAGATAASPVDLTKELDPLLETIFDQSTRHMAALSLDSVMAAVVRLERVLVKHGIVQESERTRDAIKYAKKLKRRMDESAAKALKMSSERHRKNLTERDLLDQLKKARDDAHPDRGGSSEAFQKANLAYLRQLVEAAPDAASRKKARNKYLQAAGLPGRTVT